MHQDYLTVKPVTPDMRPSSAGANGSTGQSSLPGGLSPEECLKLFAESYKQAKVEKENGGQENGLTVDLSHKRIVNIPGEAFKTIQEETQRFAVAHNFLMTLPDEFSLLKNLRYVNLRSNNFEEFPAALLRLPALDILDISRNKLRSLPSDIGNLRSLKIFSLAKNRITTLPKYVGEMKDLRIFKVHANPLQVPDEEALGRAISRDGQIINFEELRKAVGIVDEEVVLTPGTPPSDEIPSLNPGASRIELPAESHDLRPRTSGSDSGNGMLQPLAPAKNGQRRFIRAPPPAVGTPSYDSVANSTISPPLNSASSASERARSKSESTGTMRDSRKRMGIHVRPNNQLGTVDETKAVKSHHMRGYSHDSKVPNGQRLNPSEGQTDGPPGFNSRSPTEQEGAGPYFRRLSTLPEKKRTSQSAIRIVEAAQGILYSLTQASNAIEQYVSFSRARNKPLPALESVLYNSKTHSLHLIRALETYDERNDEEAVDPILEACDHNIQVFRHIITLLHSKIQPIGMDMDARFTRTLLLLLYGVHIELQAAWGSIRLILMPLLNQDGSAGGRVHMVSSSKDMRLKHGQPSHSGGYFQPMGNITTPRTPDTFHLPQTPSISQTVFHENAEHSPEYELFEAVHAATSHALTTLAQIADTVNRISMQQSLPPATQLKVQDLKMLCENGIDVAQRLKAKIPMMRENIHNPTSRERKRFIDETGLFIKHVIDIAEICRLLKTEYPFPSIVANNISTLIRLAKNLSIQTSASNGRMKETDQHSDSRHPGPQYINTQNLPRNNYPMPSTPLSAALGPAAQAIIPQIGHQTIALQTPSESRTATMLSSRTMTMSDYGPNLNSESAVSAAIASGLMSPAKEFKSGGAPPLRLS